MFGRRKAQHNTEPEPWRRPTETEYIDQAARAAGFSGKADWYVDCGQAPPIFTPKLIELLSRLDEQARGIEPPKANE